MPTVLITPESLRDREGPHLEMLRRHGLDYRYPNNPQLARGAGEEELIDELQGVDATLASMEPYTRRVLEAVGDRLRVIARVGVGYDAVDVEAATRLGVVLTITPTANHEAVAEMALALMLSVGKSLLRNDQLMRRGFWSRELIAPLRGTVLGLLGMGRIGRSMAHRGKAMGMTVLAHDPAPDLEFAERQGVRLVGLDELLEQSDYLSLHCPLNARTESIINREALAKMKPGAILVNTARGKLIDEDALLEALQNGRLLGAGLDVMRQEPPMPDHPLLTMDNVVLSPHLAGCDRFSLRDMATEAATCVSQLYHGFWPANEVVNLSLASHWKWKPTP